MIHVILKRRKHKIYYMEVNGHANFNEHGKDIVCAAVSAITFGGINALTKCSGYPSDSFEIDVRNDIVKIKISDLEHEQIQWTLETLYIQLLSIEESYSDYLKINMIGGADYDV